MMISLRLSDDKLALIIIIIHLEQFITFIPYGSLRCESLHNVTVIIASLVTLTSFIDMTQRFALLDHEECLSTR